jgi:alanyl-tRNA synthetase
VIVLGWTEDGKAGLLAAVTDDLTAKVKAGDLVKEAVALVGGKGGGKPNMAQGGGPEAAKLGAALALAKKTATAKLGA